MPTNEETLATARAHLKDLDRRMSEVMARLASLSDLPALVDRCDLESALGVLVAQNSVPAHALKG